MINLLGIVAFPVRLLRAVDQLTDEVRALRLAVESSGTAAPAPATAARRTAKAPELDLMLPGMLG